MSHSEGVCRPMYKIKSEAVVVSAPLANVITPVNCSKLVSEIIKYLIYRKQQIPYPFDHLKSVAIMHNNPRSPVGAMENKRQTISERRKNAQAAKAYEALDLIFKNLEIEMNSENSTDLKEVVLLIGSTPVSPQEVYTIILPSLTGHSESGGVGLRPSLLQLIRYFTDSSELNNILDQTIAKTNTYVFLKKRKTVETSPWFLPKDRYSLPTRGRHVIISLMQSPAHQVTNSTPTLSSLPTFKVYLDEDVTSQAVVVTNLQRVLKDSTIADCSDTDFINDSIQWFQSRSFLKGFL